MINSNVNFLKFLSLYKLLYVTSRNVTTAISPPWKPTNRYLYEVPSVTIRETVGFIYELCRCRIVTNLDRPAKQNYRIICFLCGEGGSSWIESTLS